MRHAVLTVLSVVGLWGGARLTASPAHVARVSFVNPSGYDISVDAAGGTRDGWVVLGTAQRNSTSAFTEVLDQGDEWIFRFAAQTKGGGELSVGRAQLEQEGWTVRIPDGVIGQLRARGAPPSP